MAERELDRVTDAFYELAETAQRYADENATLRSEAKEISDALRYCLKGTTITGCASPSLMDDALERLERLAGVNVGERT